MEQSLETSDINTSLVDMATDNQKCGVIKTSDNTKIYPNNTHDDDSVIATMINHNNAVDDNLVDNNLVNDNLVDDNLVDDNLYGTLVIEKIGGEDNTIFSFDINPDASGLLRTQVVTYNGCGSTMISSVSPGKYIVRLHSHTETNERLVIISPGGKGSVSFM
jgi:hypothetical protein